MALIEVSQARKTYKAAERKAGFRGALSHLVAPRYKEIRAVDGIDISIEKGEMVGFIGPNGAGKSTTIKMLTGILVPSSGDIRVMGMSPFKDRARYVARIGVVFGQKTQLWWDLPVTDTFNLLRKIYDIPDAAFRRNLEAFDDILGLADFKDRPARQLSLGQRMRADIAASLVHDPDIVFFDEPTIGLDVVAKDRIRNFIKLVNRERGVTMLLTTHDMQDIERTCERAIIIDKGRLLYDGSLSGVIAKAGSKRALIVEFNEAPDCPPIPGVEVVRENELRIRFVFDRGSVQVSELVSRLDAAFDIADMTIEEPSIESVIKDMFGSGRALS